MSIVRPLRASALALAALSMSSGFVSAKTPADFTAQDRADVTCLIAFAAVMERMSSAPNADAEALSGMSSVITYFLGKVSGRHTGSEITTILEPSFVLTLPIDDEAEIKRCSEEAIKMGQELAKAGEILESL